LILFIAPLQGFLKTKQPFTGLHPVL